MNLSREELRLLRRKLLSDFRAFAKCFISPEFWDEEYFRMLCAFFQHAPSRKHNLLCILPRSFLKTTTTALYTLWRAVQNPSLRILFVSNTAPNAKKTVLYIMGIVEQNRLFAALFPEVIPNFNRVRWSPEAAELQRPVRFPEATFEAAGIGSNLVRRHYNIIIEDDTIAPHRDDLTQEEVMPSRADIEQAVGFHRLTQPLLVNPTDLRIVVCTRWTHFDLAHYILETEKEVTAILNKPARKPNGEPRYERFDEEALKMLRISLGPYLYSALYENSPLRSEMMVFNSEWWKEYEELPIVGGRGVVSVDPADAPTGSESQCFTGIVVARHFPGEMVVVKAYRKRMNDTQLVEEVLDLCKAMELQEIIVEVDRYAHLERAFRQAMVERGEFCSLHCVKTRGKSKDERIRGLVPFIENGRIKFVKGLHHLEEELIQYPYGKVVDTIDALAWQLHLFRVAPRRALEPTPIGATSMAPTLGEMMETIKRRKVELPFQNQLGDARFLSFLN